MFKLSRFKVIGASFCVFCMMAIAFLSGKVFADTQQDQERRFVTSFDLSSGLRKDSLQWNIAGDSTGHNPNIISELTWDDIKSLQIRGTAQVVYEQHFIVEGKIAYAQISSGDNQDSDYHGDNRTLEFSRSNNEANKGYMDDFSLGAGYRVDFQEFFSNFPAGNLNVTPLVGYAFNGQNLRMRNGYQTIDTENGNIGPIDGLDTTYDTRWYGPWLGVQVQGKFKRLTGLLRWEYHWTEYYAQADWNLRTAFEHPKSFEHVGDKAQGSFLNVGAGYELSQHWQFNVDVNFYDYRMDSGIDRVFLAHGTQPETRLNEVVWESYALNAGLAYVF